MSPAPQGGDYRTPYKRGVFIMLLKREPSRARIEGKVRRPGMCREATEASRFHLDNSPSALRQRRIWPF